MEEDIEFLKDYLEGKKIQYGKKYKSFKAFRAIENLIARYKEYEQTIKKLRNTIESDYSKCIPKSKVKEKIEEVFDILDTKPYTAYTLYGDELFDSSDIKEVLKELLED